MLPDNRLSSQPVIASWQYEYPTDYDPHVDYCMGGVALNDVSQGLSSHLWKMSYDGADVRLSRIDGSYQQTLLTLADIKRLSFAFDQNMSLCYAIELENEVQFNFFDNQQNQHSVFRLENIRSPYVSFDDHRLANIQNSDVLLCYIRDNYLCVRNQRERYQIEHILKTLEVDDALLKRVDMAKNLRMQFELEI